MSLKKEEVQKLNMKNKKITLKEFWDNKIPKVIHCNTEEKAIKLLKVFDKMGMHWKNDGYYLDVGNRWGKYEENTCYSNYGTYGSVQDIKNYPKVFINEDDVLLSKCVPYTIYEFEDVIFEEDDDK